MFTALLQIKNYKLFVVNMLLLGMGIAVTVPYLICYKRFGDDDDTIWTATCTCCDKSFIVNSIIARFSDTSP